MVDGDAPNAQHLQQMQKGAFGGIEDFHYQQQIGKKGSFQFDGGGIYDQHNYRLTLEAVKQDLGFLRGGFKQYRTWYDGHGGFFPQNDQWFQLFDNNLAMDRGEYWIEGGLTLPHLPQLTIKYKHDYRDGQKDSTIWGDSSLTGGAGIRSFVPSFYDIDEKRDTILVDAKHTVGKTDLAVGVEYEIANQNNQLNVRRQPGEGINDRVVTQKDGTSSDMVNIHSSSITRFNENLMFTTGYSFTVLDSDLAGQRVYGSSYDPIYDPTFQRRPLDVGFYGLSGGSDMKQHVLSLSLFSSPATNFFVTPSVRIEKRDLSSLSSFIVTGPAQQEQSAWGNSEQGLMEVSERLEAKYTGVTNWVFYSRGNWSQGQGDTSESLFNGAAAPLISPFARDTDYDRMDQKYTVGANWYPLRRLNIDWQYYHKIHDNNFEHIVDSTSNNAYPPVSYDRYPAYLVDQNFVMDDANIRTTLRPLNNLTLVTRYDFQYSTIDNGPDQLASLQSGKMFSHVIGQSITWAPVSRLYLQPSVSYVIDRTETPAADLSGAATGKVLNSKNDYWDGSFMVGYALSAKTDIQTHYFFYYSDNYFDNSSVTMPYGAAAQEQGVTVTLIHRFSEQLRGTIKYGFFTNRDATSGHYNDYDAHLVYSSLQYRF